MVRRDSEMKLDGNVLVAVGEVQWEETERFARLCHQLLDLDDEFLVVDLTGVSFIFSASVAIISDLAMRAAERDKRVEVRINRRLEWVLKNIWGTEKRDEARPDRIIPEALEAIEIVVVD